MALFAALVGQHLLLTLVATPLLVFGRADLLLGPLGRRLASRPGQPRTALFVSLLFAGPLRGWHLPGRYYLTLTDLTLTNDLAY